MLFGLRGKALGEVPALSKRHLIADGIWVCSGRLGTAAGLLLGTRVLTEVVTPEALGEVILLLGFATLAYNTVCAPQMQAILRFCPDAERDGRLFEFRSTLVVLLRRNSALLLVLVTIVGLVYQILHDRQYGRILLLAGVVLLDVGRTFETNILAATRRQREFAIWTTADSVARPFASAAAALLFGSTPESVLAGYVIVSGILYLSFRLLLAPSVAPTQQKGAHFDSALATEIRRYSFPLILIGVTGWVTSQSDRYILEYFHLQSEVGVYAVVYALIGRPFTMVHGIVELTIRPVYFRYVSSSDKHHEREAIRFWLWTFTIVSIVGIVGTVFAKDLVARLFLAKEYRSGAQLMPVLAISSTLMCVSQILNTVSLAYKKSMNVLWSELAGAIALVTTGIPLIAKWGIAGAALASVVAYLAQFILAFVLASRYLRPREIQSFEC
jgi:O-antigen/teichoic acid export membrane protein